MAHSKTPAKHKINHWDIKTFLLFALIFTVYFCSAAGLLNSIDAPQYFTAETLIRNGSLDMSLLSRDPHYFVHPDYFIYANQILNFRGYLTSVMAVPIHLIAKSLFGFINDSAFDATVRSAANFKYELLITALFTLFSVGGLFVIKRLLEKIFGIRTALITVFFAAFGTYIWKYSAVYSRHGIVLLVSALNMYSIWKISANKKAYVFLYLFNLCLIFGLDNMLFIAECSFIILFVLWKLLTGDYAMFRFVRRNSKAMMFIMIFFLVQLFANFRLYGNPMSIQTNRAINYSSLSKTDFMSVPLYPTVIYALFGSSPLPDNVFAFYKKLPASVYTANSVEFAKKYNFYGIFAVSPFLLFFAYSLLRHAKSQVNENAADLKKANKLPHRPKESGGFGSGLLVFYCAYVFAAGVILTTKYFAFFGPNQYDIRYYFTYTFLLLPPAAGFLHGSLVKAGQGKPLAILVFLAAGFYSIFMGWIGVLNMYKPALTGERRMWVEVRDLQSFGKYQLSDYLHATFPNRDNVLIPFALSIAVYFFYLIARNRLGWAKKKKN